MRAIRCTKNALAHYGNMFRKLTGLTAYEAIFGSPYDNPPRMYSTKNRCTDATNRLTDLREALVKAGYEKEVAKLDARFLEYRLSHVFILDDEELPLTQEEWDKRWAEYVEYSHAKPYPEDAL